MSISVTSRYRRFRRYLRGVRRTFAEVGAGKALALLRKPSLAQAMAVALPAGAEVVGQRSTGNVAERTMELDMREKILELEPESTPLLVLSKRAESEVAIAPKYTWWEDELDARFDTVTEEKTAESTTIVVGTEGIWQPDDLAYVSRTGEVFRVTKNEEGKLTVVRGVGGAAAVVKAEDELIKIGSAAMEGAEDKAAVSRNPVEITNYTQIFRTPVDMTGTRRSTRDRTQPRDWDRALNHAGIEHAKDIEYAFMLGKPSVNTTGTNPRRTTGGFSHFATQNITDVGGEMTEQEFFNALTPIFRYGSKTKLAACSANAVDILTTFPRTKLRVENPNPALTYGIRVVQIIAPHGTLNVVTHWLLEGEELSEQIWIADLMNLGYRYLHGDNGSRDTHVKPEIQAPGTDGRKDEYLTECGTVIGQPKTHGKIVNITS